MIAVLQSTGHHDIILWGSPPYGVANGFGVAEEMHLHAGGFFYKGASGKITLIGADSTDLKLLSSQYNIATDNMTASYRKSSGQTFS